jgi:hypothetical protein
MSGVGIGFGLSSREGCQVRSLRLSLAGPLAAAVLMATSGCSDDPSAAPSPPASTGSVMSSSPTQSETTSTKPQGPVAFVRAWVDASNAATNSGDTSSLRMMMTARCINCQRLANAIDKIYRAGGFIRSRGWGVREVHQVGQGDLRSPVVSLQIVTYPETYKNTKDSGVKTTKQGEGGYTLWLKRVRHGFLITRIDPVT